MPLEPTTVPLAMGSQPPAYVPPVTPPSAPPPTGRLARLRAWRAGARGAVFGRGVVVEVAPGARLDVGAGAAIGAGTRLLVRAGTVRIGARGGMSPVTGASPTGMSAVCAKLAREINPQPTAAT